MIDVFATTHGLPKYRITQFNTAYYQELIPSFDVLSTWSKELRDALFKEIPFSTLTMVKEQKSSDGGTVKYLFARASDKKQFETVLMRHTDGRNTVCVSCMIGCPVRCTFCATGTMGFLGNLTAQEIVDQVLHIARFLKTENQTVTNVVFMGMGEPLLNLEAVEKAIEILTDPSKMAMSERRITVSTSGITDQLKKLLAVGYKGRLALSLHAPNQKLREQLMPIAKKYPLNELLDVFAQYAEKTNKRVSYEYILIDGLNDTKACAEELASLMDPRLSHINLIPYNPIVGMSYKRSQLSAIHAFAAILEAHHIQHTIRVTMGDDIQAACGQLATQHA
jgi:23S rRNA (adenine2503-C2)-methyltransferase